MDWDFVETVRRAEVNLAVAEISARKPAGSSIIEIGGGSGWQAQMLTDAGFRVRSFDLKGSEYSGRRVFPVEDYDGHKLPANDQTFDVAFSSNVLEHIPHVRELQSEIHRVLRPGGIAVHIVPSAAWRFWTFAGHYPWLFKAALGAVGGFAQSGQTHDAAAVSRAARRYSTAELLKRIAIPPRHGEIGSSLSEHWYFSRHRWTSLFRDTGWRIVSRATNKICYTGHGLLGNRLDLRSRAHLARILGSACHVYVLEKSKL
jgi:ubiquinone/menaquinone biosynthesis C-methylase UbiE